MSNDSSKERYVAGRWDDNNFNIFDRENGGKMVGHPWGYMSLNDAQETARKMNEGEHLAVQS